MASKPETKPEALHVHVDARRWNDTYGNTYHSVSVYRNGEYAGCIPFEYGYGDHYPHTAGCILHLKDPYALGRWAERESLGIRLTTDVIDVKRRKDLHNGGR